MSSTLLDPKRPLRDLRRRMVMSQTQAAERVGVSRSLWGAWEAQRRRISLAHMQAIRRGFQLEDGVFQQLIDHYGEGSRPEQPRPLPAWSATSPAQEA